MYEVNEVDIGAPVQMKWMDVQHVNEVDLCEIDLGWRYSRTGFRLVACSIYSSF